jgi:hypothetical protein
MHDWLFCRCINGEVWTAEGGLALNEINRELMHSDIIYHWGGNHHDIFQGTTWALTSRHTDCGKPKKN